jgi:hypothetical protein
MKLFEFFSKNNADEQDNQLEMDLEKDVMAFILDDDDVYKEYLHPLVVRISKGQKPDAEEFMDTINHCCVKFYKENQFKKDPNELFPLSMRKRMAKNLLKLNIDGRKKDKKDEDKAVTK